MLIVRVEFGQFNNGQFQNTNQQNDFYCTGTNEKEILTKLKRIPKRDINYKLTLWDNFGGEFDEDENPFITLDKGLYSILN